MGTINRNGRITRRGFLEFSSAALASAGLLGNANATAATPVVRKSMDADEPGPAPMIGNIALEEHFVLAESIDTSYAVRDLPPETRHKILDVGSGRIVEMDRGGLDICILFAE